jgi:uncharacterized protein (DUF58 family)
MSLDTTLARLSPWYLRYTRLLVLVGIMLVAYLAALNRLQPLVWGIAALLSGTLLVSLVWPHWLVRRVHVTRAGPTHANEDASITLHVSAHNRGWLPRQMIELTDHLPFVGSAASTQGATAVLLGQISYLPAGSTRSLAVTLRCEKRGLYTLGPVGLASSFPLGLAEARQQQRGGHSQLLVYPALFPISALPLRGSPSQAQRGDYPLPAGSSAAEFRSLRDYQPGDNPRHLHWASSARLNRLMLREFEPQAAATLCLVLDQAHAANAGYGKHSSFEYMVKIAASMAQFGSNQRLPTRLLGHGKAPLHIEPGSGEGHFKLMLEQLASVACDGATTYPDVLREAAHRATAGDTLVLFINAGAHAADALLAALAGLHERGLHLFAVLFDMESFRATTPALASIPAELHAALQDMRAHIVTVRRGDDLASLFGA